MRVIRPSTGITQLSKSRGLIRTPSEVEPPPSGDHPNEPVGFNVIGETHFEEDPQAQGSGWQATVSGYTRTANLSSNHQVVADPAGVMGQVRRIRLGAGHSCGNGQGTIYLSDRANADWINNYSEIYEDTWFNFWGNGTDFEDQPGQIKHLGYWGVGEAAGAVGNHVYWITLGDPHHILSGGSRFSDKFRLQMRNQEVGSFNKSPNQGHPDPYIYTAQWHRAELYMKLESAPGASNGVLKVWLDEILLMHHTDVEFRSAATDPNTGEFLYQRGFFSRHMNMVYGGACDGTYGTTKTRADDLLLASMYISGVPV